MAANNQNAVLPDLLTGCALFVDGMRLKYEAVAKICGQMCANARLMRLCYPNQLRIRNITSNWL
jgi:hypothetical protein